MKARIFRNKARLHPGCFPVGPSKRDLEDVLRWVRLVVDLDPAQTHPGDPGDKKGVIVFSVRRANGEYAIAKNNDCWGVGRSLPGG